MAEIYEINTEKMTVKINGTPYEFNEPSAEQTRAMQLRFKDFDADSEADPIEVYREFFKELGLPADALKGLSSKKILDLFAHAVGSKKN